MVEVFAIMSHASACMRTNNFAGKRGLQWKHPASATVTKPHVTMAIIIVSYHSNNQLARYCTRHTLIAYQLFSSSVGDKVNESDTYHTDWITDIVRGVVMHTKLSLHTLDHWQ